MSKRVVYVLWLTICTAILPLSSQAKLLPPLPDPPDFGEPFQQAAAVAESQSTSSPTTPAPLTSIPLENTESLVALTRPAIIYILVELAGTSTIPAFTIDLNTFTWKLIEEGKPTEVRLDQYYSGSGFVIHPDGYILTNSHVVARTNSIIETLALIKAYEVFDKTYNEANNNPALVAKLWKEHDADPKAYFARNEKARTDGTEFIKKYIAVPGVNIRVMKPQVFAATSTSAQEIIEQTSSTVEYKKQLAEQAKTGIPAEILYQNKEYKDDERDVAILKIDQTNLPSLRLAHDETVSTGSRVYLFGYPSSGNLQAEQIEPSFTSGFVSALKDSTQHTFKYLQTDAKASSGSSGGPLINESGEAVGILTKSSGGIFTIGDNFSFALPISIAKEAVTSTGVSVSTESDYASYFHKGLALLQQKHCQAALEYFELAAGMNSVFSDPRSFIEPYIDECVALVASGESIDGWLDEFFSWVGQKGVVFWVLVSGSAILIAGLGVGVFFLLRRMRKEEQLIERLEQEVEHPKVVAQPTPVQTIMPAPSTELSSFIATARAQGQTNQQIKSSLLATGWKAEDIQSVL